MRRRRPPPARPGRPTGRCRRSMARTRNPPPIRVRNAQDSPMVRELRAATTSVAWQQWCGAARRPGKEPRGPPDLLTCATLGAAPLWPRRPSPAGAWGTTSLEPCDPGRPTVAGQVLPRAGAWGTTGPSRPTPVAAKSRTCAGGPPPGPRPARLPLRDTPRPDAQRRRHPATKPPPSECLGPSDGHLGRGGRAPCCGRPEWPPRAGMRAAGR